MMFERFRSFKIAQSISKIKILEKLIYTEHHLQIIQGC